MDMINTKFRTMIIPKWREKHAVVEDFKGFGGILFFKLAGCYKGVHIFDYHLLKCAHMIYAFMPLISIIFFIINQALKSQSMRR